METDLLELTTPTQKRTQNILKLSNVDIQRRE